MQKTNPKTSLLYLLVLIMTTCPFLLCWCKRSRASKACNRGALRLGEAWARPGEAWARPRFERKTYWHKDKARLMGTRNYIVLLLKSQEGWTWSSWCLCCLARILSRSWRKGTASRQGSRPQGYGNCSKPKKIIGWNKVGGRPQCKSSTPVSQDMEIRTKHVRAGCKAGFEPGLEGLKAMEIGAKQYDKKGPFFGPQNLRKSRRAKMGLPSSRFQPQLVLVKSASTWNKRLNRFATMKVPKRDQNWTLQGLQGDHFWFQAGPLSDPFLNTFPLHGGPKMDPQQVESGASLKVRF